MKTQTKTITLALTPALLAQSEPARARRVSERQVKRRHLRIAERFVALDQLRSAVWHLRANGAPEAMAFRIVARMHVAIIEV